MERSFSIWLVAGMAQSDPSVVGSIASFINYLSQIIFTIIMVGFLGNSVSRAMISLRRIREILDTEPAMTFKDLPDEELEGSLSFENVTFTYPNDDEPMLKNVTFDIAPGQMVGVVGATGAGKSTLAQLIPRLLIRRRDLSRLVARIFETSAREPYVKQFPSSCNVLFSLVGPLQIIFVKEKAMPACQKWNVQHGLPKPANLSDAWKQI